MRPFLFWSLLIDEVLPKMRKGAVTQVVNETGNRHAEDVFSGDELLDHYGVEKEMMELFG